MATLADTLLWHLVKCPGSFAIFSLLNGKFRFTSSPCPPRNDVNRMENVATVFRCLNTTTRLTQHDLKKNL